MRSLEVVIVGAGTGGLCLAHGLQADGVCVRVFERDRAATDRPRGYRLTINPTGARALRSCLPKENFERYVAGSAKVSTGVTILDHKLRPLLAFDLPQTDQSAPDAARPISRVTLRQVLLEGLEDVVAFGKTFAAFETAPDGRVIARFEDGSTAEGDVLVGADGASSRVRRQLLPRAERIDTGIVMISGKLALDAAARRESPPPVFKGPTLVLGPRGGFMFTGAVEYPDKASVAYDRDEYVMWGFSAHRESLHIEGAVDGMSGEAARAAVLGQVRDWSPHLQRLVECADEASLSTIAVKSSVPIGPWETSRITLLGDALHNMTPYRGVGANTALRDAALLRDTLRVINADRRALLPALASYERQMIRYGFAAVRASLAQMKRVHTRSPVGRFATKVAFRLLDSWPQLRRRAMDLGSD
jgi:2-polyprenyl-6-methoxyphenol hydroxylase-like FAD-dependent oxidoreductase